MSGENVPYQLRPNKFIDRQIFLDLLAHLVVPRGTERYVYVSMGGRHLVDHQAVYNKLGLDALYSFDLDANETLRQRFNRPIGAAICSTFTSADLPSKIDEIFGEFDDRNNLIVWLDYTNTDRRAQLQEAVQTLIRLKHGDVFRITLNASAGGTLDASSWKDEDAVGPGEYRANLLRNQVSDFLPTAITSIHDNEVPSALTRCVEMAVSEAERLQPNLKIKPVLITSYKDGSRMMTVTCAITETQNLEVFPMASFSNWPFACRGWKDIQSIYAPNLSAKEQYRLDAFLHYGPKKMLAALKFLPEYDVSSSLEALKSYRAFHRYYPSFRNVDE